jgi:hypothetical protein
MGFFDSIWSGIKSVGKTIGSGFTSIGKFVGGGLTKVYNATLKPAFSFIHKKVLKPIYDKAIKPVFNMVSGAVSKVTGSAGKILDSGTNLATKSLSNIGKAEDTALKLGSNLGSILTNPLMLLAGGAVALIVITKI